MQEERFEHEEQDQDEVDVLVKRGGTNIYSLIYIFFLNLNFSFMNNIKGVSRLLFVTLLLFLF